jgi:hypothetical protein
MLSTELEQKYFPPLNVIKEGFKTLPIFHESSHPAIILNYQGIDYKCRLKYDSFINDESYWNYISTFSLEIECGDKIYIKGIYEPGTPLWVWPQFDGDIKIDLDIQQIKDCYLMYPGFDWGDGFDGYVLNKKHNIVSPEDVPIIYGVTDNAQFRELKKFYKTIECSNISKNNGGFATIRQ